MEIEHTYDNSVTDASNISIAGTPTVRSTIAKCNHRIAWRPNPCNTIIPHPWESNGTTLDLQRWLGVRKLERPEPYIYEGHQYTFDFYHRGSHTLIKIFNYIDKNEIAAYKALPLGNDIIVIIDVHAMCGTRIGFGELQDFFPISVEAGVILQHYDAFYDREFCLRFGTRSLTSRRPLASEA